MKKLTIILITISITILTLALFAFLPLKEKREYSEYRSPLMVVWELRDDLQYYFPDKENGIEKMQGWTLEKWAKEFGCNEYKRLKEYNEQSQKDYIYEKYLPIEEALIKISSREYVLDGENKYNCVDFSKDLKQELAYNGISGIMITGNSPAGYHRWIAIEFEPITGRILKPNNYESLLLSKNR